MPDIRMRTAVKTLVITRPLAQALPLAERAAALGRKVQVLPLLEILPLSDPAQVTHLATVLADLSGFAMVAFVSPNAIDACLPQIPVWPKGVALAVMGEGSRAALAAYGIHDGNAQIYRPQDPQRSDSSTLLASLDLPQLQHAQVLILRGESGREWLADTLRNAGVAVQQVAAYQRRVPILDVAKKTQLRTLIESENDWLITSSEGLRNLLKWVQQLQESSPDFDFVEKMQRQHLIVPHRRIAEVAHSLGFDKVSLSGSGDEALLVAVQSRL